MIHFQRTASDSPRAARNERPWHVAEPLWQFVEDAAQEAGVQIWLMRSPTRQRAMAQVRWRHVRRAYDAGYTKSEIARAFNRDHTSVRYALSKTA